MGIVVFIAPHERYEALEAFADKLTQEQKDRLLDAPEGETVCLEFDE
jgi:hypothetical protein